MSIWDYAHTPTDTVADFCAISECPFCCVRLHRSAVSAPLITFYHSRSEIYLGTCQLCGWWNIQQDVQERIDRFHTQIYERGSYGVLKNLDLRDINTPLQEVRDYLTAKYERRFEVNPRLFEETVGSVFADHGFSVEVTAYSGDGGVDVILTDGTARIGVQVKRYKDAIEAEEIRSLLGALVIGGMTKGIFISTSSFRSGATSAAELSARRGWPIELVDADQFYSALEISQRQVDRRSEEWIGEIIPHLRIVNSYKSLDEDGFYED
ncbi:MAG TPA: restriction endonuclease [Allosphingosinicella sp.]|nr:restriction endonuclease [Allosphingosinicella sp.]